MTNETLRLALEALDDLGDDAAAHIWPDDLKKCMTSECVVQVTSVRMGSPEGKTVPLFSREQVEEAFRAAIEAEQPKGREDVKLPPFGERTPPVMTYKDQPGNVGAWRLGEACCKAAAAPAGDPIDRGLVLLRELQAQGYGVVHLSTPPAQPAQDESAGSNAQQQADAELQPAREWVGLSTEDLAGWDQREIRSARYWEAKLREKNAGQPVVKEN